MSGGPAAVLLQIANPKVGLAVSEHSSFTKRPVQRARRTLFYLYVMAFGTPEERRYITDATHAAHAHVRDPGGAYEADDPELQLWVSATIYWSLITSYEEVYGPLDATTADQAYREFSVYATALRVPPDMWPIDRVAFKKYWDTAIAGLEITEAAKAVGHDVLYPGNNLPWAAWVYTRLTGHFSRITTTQFLPESIRNEFGIPSTVYTSIMYWLMRLHSKAVYPMLPQAVRHFGKDYHMRDLRRRIRTRAKL
ncbi:hypothetical protein F5X68DRAFT_232917 [Plectosphaerella plurivora]|uniref:ER-bound oxygenase mpaB/mpaB'/Rubber oxygenase catalytic domain-containing protein n=1 Tax=Plectosphaerella plurivora TaxID=936078 RepID=A0A9P8VA92_9PEZI|nr:hypothetical protein F5X68DRAFT_232917 [Plectosphaerella plurivora]